MAAHLDRISRDVVVLPHEPQALDRLAERPVPYYRLPPVAPAGHGSEARRDLLPIVAVGGCVGLFFIAICTIAMYFITSAHQAVITPPAQYTTINNPPQIVNPPANVKVEAPNCWISCGNGASGQQ